MFTTAGLIRSATSAKFTAPAPAATAGKPPRDAAVRGALESVGAGVRPPARMTPTRNDTAHESATVTTVNRRIYGPSPFAGYQLPVASGRGALALARTRTHTRDALPRTGYWQPVTRNFTPSLSL